MSFLVEVGVREALRYDPARSGNDYSFASYLWDVMNRRTVDFYRRRSEGFGDRRHGNDQRLTLAGLDVVNEEIEGPADDDPFEPTVSEAAVALAEEYRLGPASRRALLLLVAPVATGGTVKTAAVEAGIHPGQAQRLVAGLREELAERGVDTTG